MSENRDKLSESSTIDNRLLIRTTIVLLVYSHSHNFRTQNWKACLSCGVFNLINFKCRMQNAEYRINDSLSIFILIQ